MKYIVSILTFLKYMLIPTFASMLIWVMTNFSSSITRFVVPYLNTSREALYEVAGSYFESGNSNSNWSQISIDFINAFYTCIDYVGNWIVGINHWFPLELIVNTAAALILVEIAYLIIRFVLKIVTIGQV